MRFSDDFSNNLNCLMATEWTCGCGYYFLSLMRGGGDINCPSCGKMMEATGQIVINKGECKHSFNTDGHEYHPAVLK